MDENKQDKKPEKKKYKVRKAIFYPAIAFFAVAGIIGLVNNEWLTATSADVFSWTLSTWGWLFQWISIVCLILVAVLTFSRYGDIRIGGKDAKPKSSFMTWFFMALTGGIATGLTTWAVNEPLVYYGNIYGELDKVGIKPFTEQAEVFAMGRVFYNWSFIPYAMYVMTGLLTAYTFFNLKGKLSVSATLKPILGKHVENKAVMNVIDFLSLLSIALGLTSGLTMCITLAATGLQVGYGVEPTTTLFVGLGILITILFTTSSYLGMDKGMKRIADLNGKIYYALLILLIVVGPTIYILDTTTNGMGAWLNNFWSWGLDNANVGGDALVKWWTLFDWALWIAYAPVMGIFIAIISYGRTIREFMIVNWLLPSVFGIVWFGVWGSTAIYWQKEGVVDLVGAIQESGAVAGLWVFLQNLPFGLGVVIVPVMIFLVVVSFTTAADATTTTLASMSVEGIDIANNEEAPAAQKIIWGVSMAVIAIVLAAFGGGAQGVDGVKQLASAAAIVVIFIFVLQMVSFFKVFFIDKPIEFREAEALKVSNDAFLADQVADANTEESKEDTK